jgi:hypothetical protein
MLTRKFILLLTSGLFAFFNVKSQPFEGLAELKGFSVKAYYSAGNVERASLVASQCENTIRYIGGLVGFTPSIRVLVLSPEDWNKYATVPVYGMPHYQDDGTLVVASADNAFWRSFLPMPDQLPSGQAAIFKAAYTNADSTLSMLPFFDLLALHELGHGFHRQAGLSMQRNWMQELFCNLMLHTYIAENEPSLLPALEVFPAMVSARGTAGFRYTTLTDFESHYKNMDPVNYGWYQCRFHVAGKVIYTAGGPEILIKLWQSLKENHAEMTDAQFELFLRNKVSDEMAKVQTAW